jgi:hypothetical protein
LDNIQGKYARSALFGYAVLRANYNQNAPSYLDNFLPFVIDVLAQHHPAAENEAVVGATIRDTFGLTIPDRVVGVLLKRAVKQKRAKTQDGKKFNIRDEALADAGCLESDIVEFGRKQNELTSKFLVFVHAHYPERQALIEDEPDVHLRRFVEIYAVPLLREALEGNRNGATQWSDLHGPDYLVASFIRALASSDTLTFGYLVDAVKGAILTGVLDLGVGDIRKSLTGLTVLLDTPVLLKMLGYQGDIAKRAVQQTLDLAQRLGVKVACFEHTKREVEGVLDSVVPVLRSRGGDSGTLREVDAYFLDQGASAADVVIELGKLEQRLRGLGVVTVDAPDSYYNYGLDEAVLDDLLQEVVQYRSGGTRRYDLLSLSAVHRLRRGASPGQFERCRYVLVTDNDRVVSAARRIDERHEWPLAMLDSDLSALLWVRSPAMADDLPREQLLATAYAGMQPGGRLWRKYLEEIEQLEERGSVNQDDALILRSRPEARQALMDLTLGDLRDVDKEAIASVVTRVRNELEAPLRQEVARANAEREAALLDAQTADAAAAVQVAVVESVNDEMRSQVDALASQVEGFQTLAETQDRLIRSRSEASAHRLLTAFVLVLAVALVIPAACQVLAPQLLSAWPTAIRIAAVFGGAAAVVVSVLSDLWGGSVREWLKPIEGRVAARLEKQRRGRAGLASLHS